MRPREPRPWRSLRPSSAWPLTGTRAEAQSSRQPVHAAAYPRRMGIEVRSATGRWDDFASFMVPRKPGAGGCVCMAYRNSSLDMPGRIGHMRELCRTEPGPGVLAYVDGEVAGWCSV